MLGSVILILLEIVFYLLVRFSKIYFYKKNTWVYSFLFNLFTVINLLYGGYQVYFGSMFKAIVVFVIFIVTLALDFVPEIDDYLSEIFYNYKVGKFMSCPHCSNSLLFSRGIIFENAAYIYLLTPLKEFFVLGVCPDEGKGIRGLSHYINKLPEYVCFSEKTVDTSSTILFAENKTRTLDTTVTCARCECEVGKFVQDKFYFYNEEYPHVIDFKNTTTYGLKISTQTEVIADEDD